MNKSNMDKYIASVYWAAETILTVGYGDITPQNPIEIVSFLVIALVGASLYGYMFSKLSILFSSVNDKAYITKVPFDLKLS